MDAVKFIEERRRMVKATRGHLPIMVEGISPKDIVKEVEEWSAAHPRKTRQSVFLEQYPDAEIDSGGAIAICPTAFSSAYRDDTEKCVYVSCAKCRREFWMQEVE